MRENRFHRPSYIEVNLDIIAENFKNIKEKLPAGVALQTVVKSNAYGHGAVEVSKTLEENGTDYLGVALLEEGIELREAGIKVPIIVLYPEPAERAELFLDYNLIPTICEINFATAINDLIKPDRKLDIYLKVDTGMSRYGPDSKEINSLVDEISKLGNLRIAGLSSNFSTSDNGNKDFCFEQIFRFRNAVGALNGTGSSSMMVSIANSGAMLDLPESYFNMVRVGLLLYGYYPSVENSKSVKVKPALKLVSKVLYVRDIEADQPVGYGMSYITSHSMKIATIPVGYGDGYPRALSNRGQVLIRGQRAPIVGRVCMDAFMVDVSNIDGVKNGDDVALIGNQGNEFIGADELAKICDTITWEITCGLTTRLPITYLHKDVTKTKPIKI
ncbi:MAG: alanine racemase [candidate division Zixibacteria bacterium]|nr:alanine racemase [candidate division Zixibacteria bacterium]